MDEHAIAMTDDLALAEDLQIGLTIATPGLTEAVRLKETVKMGLTLTPAETDKRIARKKEKEKAEKSSCCDFNLDNEIDKAKSKK